jgi:hypothetical protein
MRAQHLLQFILISLISCGASQKISSSFAIPPPPPPAPLTMDHSN